MSDFISKTFNLTLIELLFLAGLSAYTSGQFLIFVYFDDLESLHALAPIDFAHWFMLVGLLLLLPQGMHFPKSKLHALGGPLFVLGIGLLISGFSYYKYSRVGTLLVLLGTFIVLAGGGWLNVLGYSVLTIGFAVCFYHHPALSPA